MKIITFTVFILLIFSCSSQRKAKSSSKNYKVICLAFYNVENLFDTVDATDKNDEASPIMEMDSARRKKVYPKKIKHTARVISDIGRQLTKQPPAIIGLAEIENQKVIDDLLNTSFLQKHNYGSVHFESPDERGIDVGLLYRKAVFKPRSISSHELVLYRRDNRNKRDYTRDQLLVSGLLDGDKIHIIVNHWPSRRGGVKASRPNRQKAAKLNKHIIDSLQAEEPYAKVITMGDFNDDPYDSSLKKVLGTKGKKDKVSSKGIYNPMESMQKQGIGSSAYRDTWNLFDQIIMSSPLLSSDLSSYRYYKAGVFNPDYLTSSHGQYKGYPYRSFSGGGFSGGYSDHFPVFVYLVKSADKETR